MESIKEENIRKLFVRYLIPAVTGTLSVGMLIFIDTVFIGRGIGSRGLAALNTVIPAFTFYFSTGLLLGIGGATAAAVDAGRGDNKGKNSIFTHCIVMAVILGIIYIFLQSLFLERLCYFLGATEAIFPMVKEYLGVISKFTMFYILPDILGSFIRNDRNPNAVMMGMVTCGITNIVLDYTFIFQLNMGMKGAALATGIAQFCYFLVLLTHFRSGKNTLKLIKGKMRSDTAGRIMKIGFPSFINEMSVGVVIFAFNFVLFRLGGDVAVSAYSIILNINFLVYLIYMGISHAAQPLLSYNYGGGLYSRVEKTRKLSLGSAALVGITTILISVFFRYEIIALFSKNNLQLTEIAGKGMVLFFSASLFMGINIIMAAYFQSVEKSHLSTVITLLRGLVLVLIGVFILPIFMGIKGVWMATIFAESITLVITGVFFLRNIRIAEEIKR